MCNTRVAILFVEVVNEHNCSFKRQFWAIFYLHFYGDARLDNAAQVGYREHIGVHTDETARENRLAELQFLNAVVYLHLQVPDIDNLLPVVGHQRSCEVAVGDGAVERRLHFGALNIGVNPLVVERHIGKLINHFLRNLLPVRGANLFALKGFQLFVVVDYMFHNCSFLIKSAIH